MAETEGTYEYECMRAELLGISKPTLQEFEESQKLRDENEKKEEEIERMKVRNAVHKFLNETNCLYSNFFLMSISGNRFK